MDSKAIWEDAMLAAVLMAVDPVGIGGVVLRALPGPVRDRWLTAARAVLPPGTRVRRVPLHVSEGRLLGGLDLAATLEAGAPVSERGLLAETDGGVVVLPMAERLARSTAAHLSAALDAGELTIERDGFALRLPARLGVIALDEGATPEERPPAALLDRLALQLDLSSVAIRDAETEAPYEADAIRAARARLSDVEVGDEGLEALCACAQSLGIGSIRAPLLALRVARACAALAGDPQVTQDDVAVAARLVLAPRASVWPAEQGEEQDVEGEPDAAPPDSDRHDSDSASGEAEADDDVSWDDRPLEDTVLEAARAAIPAGLMAQLRSGVAARSRAASPGKAGALQQSQLRGRPVGVRRGEPRAGARLSVIETLRAAAPWQPVRRRESRLRGRPGERIEVRREDFRVTRFKQRAETTTIFVVDASGSAALHRLAEAKGAVELLLADCYVRRDQVALISFRGQGAELLLPPTRSLVRAKRGLSSLPGGGGTPLASGIDAALAVADAVRWHGATPSIVLLTDGRANIARDGAPGRAQAEEDALAAARRVRSEGVSIVLVDTSPRPQPKARTLAEEMGAIYLALPYADAAVLSQAVRTTAIAG